MSLMIWLTGENEAFGEEMSLNIPFKILLTLAKTSQFFLDFFAETLQLLQFSL